MNIDSLLLRDKVAVVTGGSRGIGSAVVEILASLGADVVVNYLKDAVAAEQVAEAVRGKGSRALSFQADVANPIEAERLIDTAINAFKRVDILVCNAGVWEGSPIDKMTEELWDKTLDINLKGCWSVCRAVVPPMKKQRSGKIVMVTSTAGQRGEANFSNYAASKGGLIAFTKSLAAELAEWKINVNAVAPGWVDTEMTQEALGDYQQRESIASTIPLGTIAKPEEIAAPIAFLCTDWARHITGEVLNVNGGS
ncbi:MAG: 3-oxoacyl-ACP reductase FabG, partial [Acidobacteriota bacterium]|nr:3-oxoacyl-ACP reductase FabG [Acidobacteriota bacterium]